MRIVLAFAIVLCLAGCETSPLGGRCTLNSDCDRATTGATATCVSATNPALSCGGSSTSSCICCPIRVVSADGGVADSGVIGCGPGQAAVDVQAVDATVDTGQPDVTDAGCLCDAGSYCSASLVDGGTMCSLVKAIGQACGGGNECQTGHCVDGVCCNSACTGAGLSCNVSPDFAGLCSPETTTDAGTDAGTDVGTDAGTDAGVDVAFDATDAATE